MKTKKKPHLGGIKEFRAMAYVKDLHTGKLDTHACVGWFVGYDSEYKGYHIYWRDKKSVMVKWNIVFNKNHKTLEDTNLTVLAEGEKEKVIQAPVPNQSTILPPTGPQVNVPQTHILLPESPEEDSPDSEPSNSVPFPSSVVIYCPRWLKPVLTKNWNMVEGGMQAESHPEHTNAWMMDNHLSMLM